MKSEIRILGIDLDWDAALGCGSEVRVYGSFEHVVDGVLAVDGSRKSSPVGGGRYYQDVEGSLCQDVFLWIGSRGCSLGPGGLVLDCDTLPDTLRSARSLSVVKHEAGSYTLNLSQDQASLKTFLLMKASREPMVCEQRTARVKVAREALGLCSERTRFLLETYGDVRSPYLHTSGRAGMHDRLVDGGARLCRLLVEQNDDAETLRLALSRVVGLGLGLTPSADDFVVGALAAASVLLDTKDRYTASLRSAMHAVASGTTNVSRMYLLSAAYGRFSNVVLEALEELLCVETYGEADKQATCPPAILRLLNHGSTSGTDTLAGISCMLEYLSRIDAESISVLGAMRSPRHEAHPTAVCCRGGKAPNYVQVPTVEGLSRY